MTCRNPELQRTVRHAAGEHEACRSASAFYNASATVRRASIWILAAVLLATLCSLPAARAQGTRSAETIPIRVRRDIRGHFLYWFVRPNDITSEAFLMPDAGADNMVKVDVPIDYAKPDAMLEVLNEDNGMAARVPLNRYGITTVTDADFLYTRTLRVPVVTSRGQKVKGVLITLKYTDSHLGLIKQQYWLATRDMGEGRFNDVPINVRMSLSVRFDTLIDQTMVNKLSGSAGSGYTVPPLVVNWPNVPYDQERYDIKVPGLKKVTGLPSEGGNSTYAMFAAIVFVLIIALGLFWLVDSGRANGMLLKLGIQVAPTAPAPALAGGRMPGGPMRPSPRPVPREAMGGDVGAVPGSGPRLVATLGPHAGSIFPLKDPQILVGRDIDNTVALTQDSAASRKHAHIQANSGQFILVDDGSSNGTYVNGVRIATKKPQTLHSGDEVQIGTTRFRFEA
jgi:hypothetical protein